MHEKCKSCGTVFEVNHSILTSNIQWLKCGVCNKKWALSLVMIVIPIILPLIEALGFNLTWFAILVAVNLQTAWLSPPVALSAYFLKGVVPSWDLKDIYLGMMQFMVIQVIGLVIIILYPKIVLWLPTLLYGQ